MITSIARVNLADRKSEVRDTLFEDYKKKFPEYLKNPYVKNMSGKYKLIHFCIHTKNYLLLNIIMNANNVIKGK